jgi:hypothetical protein
MINGGDDMASVFNCSECGFLAERQYELTNHFAETGHKNKSLVARLVGIFHR